MEKAQYETKASCMDCTSFTPRDDKMETPTDSRANTTLRTKNSPHCGLLSHRSLTSAGRRWANAGARILSANALFVHFNPLIAACISSDVKIKSLLVSIGRHCVLRPRAHLWALGSWLWLLRTEQAKVQPIEKFSLLFQLIPLTLSQSKTVIYPTEQHRIHGKNQ